MINFFRSNGLVNNADKAAVIYNGKGKSEAITVENVGGEDLVSTYSEKLLGLHVLLLPPNRPKNQRNFCKDFCPSLLKEVK